MPRPEPFRIESAGDLEAVIVAETFDLLAEIFGPYSFTVVGPPGDQQASFETRAHNTLFFVRLHEFLAEASDIFRGQSAPRNISLFGGGKWLIEQYTEEAAASGLCDAASELSRWLDRTVEIRFWSGDLSRHLHFRERFRILLAPQSHFAKHSLLKLGTEVRRLRSMCARASCDLSDAEAVAARRDFEQHLDGMMQYHATELAELVGRYYLAFYRFIRGRFDESPTNNLNDIRSPAGITDDVFRYLYASAVVSLSRWTEHRIQSCIPETSPSLRMVYPQHSGADPA